MHVSGCLRCCRMVDLLMQICCEKEVVVGEGVLLSKFEISEGEIRVVVRNRGHGLQRYIGKEGLIGWFDAGGKRR